MDYWCFYSWIFTAPKKAMRIIYEYMIIYTEVKGFCQVCGETGMKKNSL